MPAPPPRKLTPPRDLRTHTEAQWQSVVVDLAATFGWVCLHIRDSRGEQEGVPDLMMWRDDDYLLVELKTERGVVSAKQREWHMLAALKGVTTYIWRPRHYPDAVRLICRGYDVEIDW